tara:strand:- start:313 stop:573 length:261 start_codon:yes stop_codon:yes gene_type:complete
MDLIITGKVQGVGFRYFVKKEAEKLGISGYVKNEIDGSVFVVAEGNLNDLESLTKLCNLGSPHSVVKKVKIIKKQIENLEGFNVIY